MNIMSILHSEFQLKSCDTTILLKKTTIHDRLENKNTVRLSALRRSIQYTKRFPKESNSETCTYLISEDPFQMPVFPSSYQAVLVNLKQNLYGMVKCPSFKKS